MSSLRSLSTLSGCAKAGDSGNSLPNVIRAVRLVAVAIAFVGFGYGSQANGQVYEWAGTFSDSWDNSFNWTGAFEVPDSTSEAAVIENQSNHPELKTDVGLGGLTVRNGGCLDLNGFNLILNVGPAGFIGRTNLSSSGQIIVPTNSNFDTERLTVGGILAIQGGHVEIDTSAEVLDGGLVSGRGTFELFGSELRNNGIIRSNGGQLNITRLNTASFDWDGNSGAGVLVALPSSTLKIDVPPSDSFDGNISLGASSVFQCDLDWILNQERCLPEMVPGLEEPR